MKSSNVNPPYIKDVGCIYFIVKSFLLIIFYSSGNFSKKTNINVAIGPKNNEIKNQLSPDRFFP